MGKYDNKNTGNLGEDLAEDYLKKKGYKILERNWHNKFGELDLVIKDKETTVFVEVKTKVGEDFGTPEEMVDKRKIAKVRRAGEMYLKSIDRDVSCRIDVVVVVLSYLGQVERLDHYENVY